MKWLIVAFSVLLGSVSSDICDLCACTFQDNSDYPHTVSCNCSDENSEVHIRSSAPRLRNATRFKVVGCGRVVLHEGAFSGAGLRHAAIERAGLVEVRGEALLGATLYTLQFQDVGRIAFEKDSLRGGIADTVTLTRAYVPNLPRLGAYLRSIKDELSLTNVTIDNIERNAINLLMSHSNSAFCLDNVKIHNIQPEAISVEASKIEILSSGFGPYPSGIKLVGRRYIHICNNHVIQKKPNDFFDVYSPYINLTGNIFALMVESFGDLVKTTKHGKLITYKNVIEDEVVIVV